MPANRPLDLTAMRERAETASELLKLLSNPQRLRVMCLLANQEMSVGQLNAELPDLSQSALSQHLGRLRAAALVRTRREAQTIWYSLQPGPAEAIIAALYGIYCGNPSPGRD